MAKTMWPYSQGRAAAVRLGRRTAENLKGQPVANIHQGTEHALTELEHLEEAHAHAIEQDFQKRKEPLVTRQQELTVEEAQLQAMEDEQEHPLLPPYWEGSLLKFKLLILAVVIAAEFAFAKAALQILRLDLVETSLITLGVLLVVIVLAHSSGAFLRAHRSWGAALCFLVANVVNVALTYLRVLFIQTQNMHGMSPQTLFWTMWTLGFGLLMMAVILGTVRVTRQQRLNAVQRKQSQVTEKLEAFTKAHAEMQAEQRRYAQALRNSFWEGYQEVMKDSLLVRRYFETTQSS